MISDLRGNLAPLPQGRRPFTCSHLFTECVNKPCKKKRSKAIVFSEEKLLSVYMPVLEGGGGKKGTLVHVLGVFLAKISNSLGSY